MDNPQNTDDLIGLNMPRGSYGLSGSDWQLERGDGIGPPIIINANNPGVGHFINDAGEDSWATTYGASYDSFLGLIDGAEVAESKRQNNLVAPYDSLPSTATYNIWDLVGEHQQIQYIVSGGTIDEGAAATEGITSIEDARGIGMRLPMMAVGYGPSIEMGKILSGGEGILNRDEWKTGSVDIRWDNRRQTWAAYNDLIADHEGETLGTAVFSTNPDAKEGFPLLKGRLQDVWWVRQPVDLDGEDGNSDGAQTAKIMTHLEHEFYDNEEEGAAALNTLFIIPQKSLPAPGTPDVCFTAGEDNVLGNETTGDADAIAILTDAGFWFDSTQYGPLNFTQSVSDLGNAICCINTQSKLFVGEMIFVDESIPDCGTEPRDVGFDEDNCYWAPAVRIDECELVGSHFEVLFDNDAAVAKTTHGLCMSIYGWSQNLVGEIVANDSILKDGIDCNNDEIRKVADTLLACIKENAGYTTSIMLRIYSDVQQAFDIFAKHIQALLATCGCEVEVLTPRINFGNDVSVVVPGKKIKVDECKTNPGAVNAFDCANCVPIELEAPCAENQSEAPFVVGLPCAGSTLKNKPDYTEVGSCSTS